MIGYLTAIDELNVLWQVSLQTAGRNPERVCGDLEGLLILAYREGFRDANGQLEGQEKPSDALMEAAVYAEIDRKNFEDRAREHLASGDAGRLQTLAESEWHRVYHAGMQDAATAYQQRTGRGVLKTWQTMLDDRVRDTHDYLESISVPFDAEFYTFDGDHAPAPGGFTRPENNVNCRCSLRLTGEGTPKNAGS